MMKTDLTGLRAIGWALWNPIALDGPPNTPSDEYDPYLLRAAEMLANRSTQDAVVAYLIRSVEIDMGLAPANRNAAQATVAAIATLLAAE